MHMKGHATDIVVAGMTPGEVQDACEKFDGLGRYDSFTHVDSRGYKARWDLRKVKKARKIKEVSIEEIQKDLGD